MKVGKLNQFLYQPPGQFEQSGTDSHRDNAPRPPLGTINVIFTKPGSSEGSATGVRSISGGGDLVVGGQVSKKAKLMVTPTLGFSDEDKEGAIQPYDDALVVTVRIGGYDVRRVLDDQGSGVEIMYPDLYKRLNLRPEDLKRYDSPLMGFDGKMMVPGE